jgi:hypothetical protein
MEWSVDDMSLAPHARDRGIRPTHPELGIYTGTADVYDIKKCTQGGIFAN